jgi:small-conductance mechanosensitive channel
MARPRTRLALEARSQQRRFPFCGRLRAFARDHAAAAGGLAGRCFRDLMLTPLSCPAALAPKSALFWATDGLPLAGRLRAPSLGRRYRLTLWLTSCWFSLQPPQEQLGSFLTNLFQKLRTGALRSIPGIFTVFVIFLLTRIVARIVSGIFSEVEKGDLAVPWLDADTARATRRLAVVMVWIFALTVAYPYVPGSSTNAFKGVSVFVGLIVSLGSAGLVNQVMSGFVVIYSRALKPGEFVQVGNDLGTVSEIGMLSTKLLTRKREEITIPNAVLVGTKTVNYSRHAAGDGAGLGTTLTIGYDAPWRLVHAMLLQAAAQTPGVRKDPGPRVWQKALSDFYIEYELVLNLDKPEDRIPILSELHTHILDAFNEHGVQIMSPHFESQPKEPVVVPRSQWFPSTATE